MKTLFSHTMNMLGMLAAVLASAGSLSVSVTQVPFTAIEDSRHEPFSAVPWALELGLGIGFPEMERLNDYITWINRTNKGNVDAIDSYQSYSGRLSYGIQPDLRLGIGYEYLDAHADGQVVFMGNARTLDMDLDVRGIFLFLEKSWPIPAGPLHLQCAAEGAVGYYRSSYVETEKGYRASGDDEAVGTEAGVSLSWLLTKHLAFTVEGAYRWLEFDDYGVSWVSPGKPAAEIDFTGLVVRVFLGGRF